MGGLPRAQRVFEAAASSDEREAFLDEYRLKCRLEVAERVARDMDPADPPEVQELESKLSASFQTLMVRPQPTGAKLRYNHQPIIKRSYAYPGMTFAAQPAAVAAAPQDVYDA